MTAPASHAPTSHAPVVVPGGFGVGDTREVVLVEDLSRTQIVQYAGASGDYNPMHTDEVLAREVAGVPTVFAHGTEVETDTTEEEIVRARLSLETVNQRGEIVLKGAATVLVLNGNER